MLRILVVLGLSSAFAMGQGNVLIAKGRPLAVCSDGTREGRWHEEDGSYVGRGDRNLLLARVRPGGADFAVNLRLRVEAPASGAAVLIGEEWFTLADEEGHFAVEGPRLGRRKLGPSTCIDGHPSEVRIARHAGTWSFDVDGQAILAAPVGDTDDIDRVGLWPQQATLRVEQFAIEGGIALLDPRVATLESGFSIPQIDLAGENARQVLVDREAGQYLGHPTTVLLEDGRTMIAVYPKGHGKGAIVMKRSTDGGRTWSDRLPVPASWATSLEVPTIHRTVDREGHRRLILFSGLRPIRRAVSEDDGRTWSELESIGGCGGIVAMGALERARDGSYLAWFHDDGRYIAEGSKPQSPVRFTLYQVRSQDGGLTWNAPETIWSGTREHLCEPGVVRDPRSATLALMLRENSRRFPSQVIFSDDDGVHWTAPVPMAGALTGDRHVARVAPDGSLVVTFRDTGPLSPTQGDWVIWVGSFQDLRDGTAGRFRARLMDNRHAWDCAYSGLELLPDGTFVATTYGHWTEGEPPYEMSVRFTLAELLARAGL
ncbi:MAG: sialidase family protein [Planctomycetota bacterium]